MKKILLVTAELGYRGTPRTLANYARIFRQLGFEVFVWGYAEGGETAEVLRHEGFAVCVGWDGLNLAQDFKPDILNIHRPGIFLPREYEIIKTFKAQGVKVMETNIFGWVDRKTLPMIDLSMQISYWDLFMWASWKGTLKTKGVYCPNPVDTESFVRSDEDAIASKRKEWDVPRDAFVLGRIGKTSWNLTERPLLQALNGDPALYLVHVEDYNSQPPQSILSHPRFRIQKRLVGERPLCDFYSACNACLNVFTVGESFGCVNAEAMSCGTPIVALATPLRCNAQSEMTVNGHGGVVMAQAKELPSALGEVARGFDPEEVRDLIVKRYSFDVVKDILASAVDVLSTGIGGQDDEARARTECRRIFANCMGKYPMGTSLRMRMIYTPLASRLIEAYHRQKHFGQ